MTVIIIASAVAVGLLLTFGFWWTVIRDAKPVPVSEGTEQ